MTSMAMYHRPPPNDPPLPNKGPNGFAISICSDNISSDVIGSKQPPEATQGQFIDQGAHQVRDL